ncbi:GNAT family N-acetyltransferase [Devosia albogilva]|uniref:GNAT family N-acetyltransferase n=1 Tax=Devosia albogilva TaxID=429726 RepID=A0ABW5QLQ7_9HYPH
MDALHTELLADRPEVIGALVELMESVWADWYHPGGASARAELSERLQRDRLPLGIVALNGEAAVGTCALTVSSGGLVTERSPWIGGLVVDPRWRRRGVGLLLLQRARHEAKRLGYTRVYALTAEAMALFEAAGWRHVDTLTVSDEAHAVFEISA